MSEGAFGVVRIDEERGGGDERANLSVGRTCADLTGKRRREPRIKLELYTLGAGEQRCVSKSNIATYTPPPPKHTRWTKEVCEKTHHPFPLPRSSSLMAKSELHFPQVT